MLLEHFLTTESKKGKCLVQKVIITYFIDFAYVKIIPGCTMHACNVHTYVGGVVQLHFNVIGNFYASS